MNSPRKQTTPRNPGRPVETGDEPVPEWPVVISREGDSGAIRLSLVGVARIIAIAGIVTVAVCWSTHLVEGGTALPWLVGLGALGLSVKGPTRGYDSFVLHPDRLEALCDKTIEETVRYADLTCVQFVPTFPVLAGGEGWLVVRAGQRRLLIPGWAATRMAPVLGLHAVPVLAQRLMADVQRGGEVRIDESLLLAAAWVTATSAFLANLCYVGWRSLAGRQVSGVEGGMEKIMGLIGLAVAIWAFVKTWQWALRVMRSGVIVRAGGVHALRGSSHLEWGGFTLERGEDWLLLKARGQRMLVLTTARNVAALPLLVKRLSPASLKRADEFLVANPMLSALCAASWQELEVDFDDDLELDEDLELDGDLERDEDVELDEDSELDEDLERHKKT